MALQIEWMRVPGIAPKLFDTEWEDDIKMQYGGFIREILIRCGINIPIRISISHPADKNFPYGASFFTIHIEEGKEMPCIEIEEPVLDDLPIEEFNAILAHEIGHLKSWQRIGTKFFDAKTTLLGESRADHFSEKMVGIDGIIAYREKARKTNQNFYDRKFNETLLTLLYRRQNKSLQT